ncbi:DEAD/DEAH box helicase domain-containing protein [Toxoplasma gondii ARI]|uniref:DEAD/DEAH box helicase domain-containing protein n=1 Tax=Toxoplasma gondii ARI TaxID=1074872 RepID=A0A139XJL8_TOXGO|nr:DEAD/DEAH box helicase domain-containing protein [Toxoplasma gondii ARI]
MSASLSLEFFASYFRRLPLSALSPPSHQRHSARSPSALASSTASVVTLYVPGRAYPVSVFYAEDVCRFLEQEGEGESLGSACVAFRPAALGAGPGGAAALSAGFSSEETGERAFVSSFSSSVAVAPLPDIIRAICSLICFLHHTRPLRAADIERGAPVTRTKREEKSQGGGAILVFLSGVGEVNSACRACEDLKLPLWILPCHAALQPAQQQKVFHPAPRGLRKVVISTNIAETSITIPDVSYVIDSGLHKQMEYDSYRRLSRLQEQAISRSSAQQRAGRAGRVTAGECFRLYERRTFEKYMKECETPELQRQPLENVCLQLKAIFPQVPLQQILAECIEPPSQANIVSAIKNLECLGALQRSRSADDCDGVRGESREQVERRTHERERLTNLGRVLSLFPVDLAFARMLIYSAALSCLEEMTALCALLAVESSLYVSHLINPNALANRRKYFSKSQSDFITNLRIFFTWRLAQRKGRKAEDQFCQKFGVNPQSMRNAEELRKRFSRVVEDVGLRDLALDQEPSQGSEREASAAFDLAGGAAEDAYEDAIDKRICTTLLEQETLALSLQTEPSSAEDAPESRSLETKLRETKGSAEDRTSRSIVWRLKACIVAGLYPQVAVVRAPRKRFVHVASGTVEKPPEPWEIKYFTRVEEETEGGTPSSASEAPQNLLQR